jgi:hypothetical protein
MIAGGQNSRSGGRGEAGLAWGCVWLRRPLIVCSPPGPSVALSLAFIMVRALTLAAVLGLASAKFLHPREFYEERFVDWMR